MPTASPRVLVTGAAGQLGRLVTDALLQAVPADRVAVAVRDPAAVAGLAARGVRVHAADYDRPATLDAALAGVDRVLLISSNAMGRRVPQHRHVIDAARRGGVTLLAYTSVLRADRSELVVADEHLATEEALRDSGVPFALLRNGWYTENYAAGIPAALAHGAVLGSAGGGRVASAARADYAAAAAAVLTTDGHAGQTYELAGDDAYTLPEFAAELARQSGQPVRYQDLPEAEFRAALIGAGLPGPLAALLADSDAGVAKGALYDGGRQLSRLIGRPTKPLASVIKTALAR